MRMPFPNRLMVVAIVSGLSSGALADSSHRNHFASILVDGKKIGHVHYSVMHNDQGELEELRTKASVSVFGIKLYDFTQHLHEQWADGELQSLRGHTNDDGQIDDILLTRAAGEYEGSLNDAPLTLSLDAFPISLWHYKVTQQTTLFDLTDLRKLKVSVSGQGDTVVRGSETIQAERFDFTGDWDGSVWFDQDKQFLKAEYTSDDRRITVMMDP